MDEFNLKHGRILELLDKHRLDGLLLRRVSSFAWATCGVASYVNTATSFGEAALLVTREGRYLVTNNIEASRLEREENLTEQGWEFRVAPWYETNQEIQNLTGGLRVGSDAPMDGYLDLSKAVARLRARLTPEEGQRFRDLGRLCAEAMNAAALAVRPGQSEHEIAGLLATQAEGRGVQVVVNLVATDERIFDFRHPLPTGKQLDRYAMLILCGRRSGLVCSITRLVHFGRLSGHLRRKAEAVAEVDAHFIAATKPGALIADIFEQGTAAYARAGFPDEWRLHHQGGPAGYEPREWIATPHVDDPVYAGQVYAWNPSITGTKSEDTILVGEGGNEVLTEITNWPALSITVDGEVFSRPAILEVV